MASLPDTLAPPLAPSWPQGETAARRQPEPSLAWPLVALVVGAVAMGISPLFVRAVAGEVGPFASAFWRVALSLPLLYAWMRWEERGRPAGRAGAAMLWGGVAFSGDLIFWHLAILATSVANATFLATTAPLFVIAIGWLVLGRRPGASTLWGLALCLVGGAALVGSSLGSGRLPGDVFGLCTAFFFGLYFLFVAKGRESAGAGRVTLVASLVTAAILLVAALVMEPHRFWPQTGAVWAALLALAWVSHAAGQGLLAVALGRLPAVFSSLCIFLEAVVAAIAGWLWLGEAVSAAQAAGGAAILAGIWVARPATRSEVR